MKFIHKFVGVLFLQSLWTLSIAGGPQQCRKGQPCNCGEDRVYDELEKACVIMVGSDCSPGQDTKCVSNSVCNEDHCECFEGYFITKNRTCEKNRDYGEECLSNQMCKRDLKCGFHGVGFIFRCECWEGRVFDNSTGLCLVAAGEGCIDENCVSNAFCKKQNRRSFYNSSTCQGYNCHKEGKCTCFPDYFQTKEKTCEAKQGYGGLCEISEGCKYNYRCSSEGICGCDNNNGTSALHPVSKLCVGTRDSYCSDSGCVPNAHCSRGNKCTCSEYATNSSKDDGYCFVKEGFQCDSDSGSEMPADSNKTKTCLPGLLCTNECSCLIPDHQVYDSSLEKCLSLIGGPCNASLECVENAECRDDENGGLQICRCKEGFIPVDRQCDLAFARNCSQDQMSQSTSPKCDRWAQLKCSSRGICECSHFHRYDEERRMCVGLVGARCDVKKEGACSTGSFCRPFRGSRMGVGMCVCEQGLRLDAENRSCH